ncbi:EAL domain-containing protein [Neptuniibacter sp. QD48_11]|uniref:EAL domain-containing protein n=1 Tax=unclassified Neptuniibacter TaxID=2630693 RepID=UPI0039F4F9E4
MLNCSLNVVSGSSLELLDLVEQQRFGVEYQPLIDAHTGDILGYEALARFYHADGRAIPPLDVFQVLHDSPLMLAQVELQLKRLQMRYRPEGVALFLNLDPHAFSVCTDGDGSGQNAMVNLLKGNTDLVIELIENTDVNDAKISNDVSELMRKQGIAIALDDVGAPGSMIAMNILSEVDYIKFDRSWLRDDLTENMQLLIKSVIGFARVSGKKTVLEGVESAEDLATAIKLGIDYVQGFFYQELFIQKRCFD